MNALPVQICCDKCNVWQHTVCVELAVNDVPQVYYCDLCQPRVLNVDRAREIQRHKADDHDREDFSYRYVVSRIQGFSASMVVLVAYVLGVRITMH